MRHKISQVRNLRDIMQRILDAIHEKEPGEEVIDDILDTYIIVKRTDA